jgi:hypothetical protein
MLMLLIIVAAAIGRQHGLLFFGQGCQSAQLYLMIPSLEVLVQLDVDTADAAFVGTE